MKWIVRILIGLFVIVIGLLVFAFWPFANRLGGLNAAGDPYDVEILRDSWGVPHIFGVTDADAAFGLAYAHAEDDFLTIQQGVVAARGDLSKFYGMDAAANDYMVDLLKIWDLIDRQYEVELSAETRALVEAYAAGINLYAAHHPDEAFRGVYPVDGKDVVAGSVHKSPLFFGLDGTLGRLFEEVQEEEDPSSQPSPSGEGARSPLQALWKRGASNVPFTPYALRNTSFTGLGSNVIAVAPSRTSDGSTYFTSNSHQPWEGPVTWWEAHMHSEEGLDVTGGLFPGMPVVTLGHNRDVAWSFTVNSPDLIDVYVLELNPDNTDQYLFDGVWRDFEIERGWLSVNLVRTLGWGSETFGRFNIPIPREIVWSAHGPVFRNDTEAYAIRYAGYDSVGVYEQLYQMNRASNQQEWLAALRTPGLPMFNAGYADKDGNIGYIYNARMPERADGFDWQNDLDGTTSANLWATYADLAALPQVWNPPVGFIQNANSSPYQTTRTQHDPQESATPASFGIETLMTNRALRLIELFSADESITWDEFHTYKYDMAFSAESDMADWVQRISSHKFEMAPVQQAADLLAEWNLEMTPNSAGASLALLTLAFAIESPDADIGISHLVGSEVSDEVLFESFELAVEELREHNFGRIDVPLAQINRVRRGAVDMGIGGAPDVPHAIYGPLQDDGRMVGIAGESYIMLARWDSDGNLSSESIVQYGSATLDESSPHYNDQVELFVNRQLKPVLFDEADIRANLERAYRPQDQ